MAVATRRPASTAATERARLTARRQAWPLRTDVRLPVPVDTRILVLRRAASRCEMCAVFFRFGRGLQLHHCRYHFDEGNGPQAIFGLELPDDMLALCDRCHHLRHRPFGRYMFEPDFWLEPSTWVKQGGGHHMSSFLRGRVIAKPPLQVAARLERENDLARGTLLQAVEAVLRDVDTCQPQEQYSFSAFR
jgi:hypothetical protein